MTYLSQKAIPNLEANLMYDCDFVLCHLLVWFCRQRFLLNKTDLKELSMSSVSHLFFENLSRWWIQFLVHIFKSNLYIPGLASNRLWCSHTTWRGRSRQTSDNSPHSFWIYHGNHIQIEDKQGSGTTVNIFSLKNHRKKLSPVDIASTKIRKVTKFCRKNLPRLCQIVAGDGNFNGKKYLLWLWWKYEHFPG